jgi:hypothetical protein
LFGVGSDPIIGLGNIAFSLNQNWFPSFVLSRDDESGAIDGPLALVRELAFDAAEDPAFFGLR